MKSKVEKNIRNYVNKVWKDNDDNLGFRVRDDNKIEEIERLEFTKKELLKYSTLLIDYLNSQDQEEEKKDKFGVELSEGVYLSAEIVERRGKIGKEILNIINNWGEYTSEGSIYWEPCGGKDPEQEIVKEVIELMVAYSESVIQDIYEEFLVWEMERNLTKEQKEIFDDLLSKLTTK